MKRKTLFDKQMLALLETEISNKTACDLVAGIMESKLNGCWTFDGLMNIFNKYYTDLLNWETGKKEFNDDKYWSNHCSIRAKHYLIIDYLDIVSTNKIIKLL